jgi:hypothetical protein
MTSEIRNKSASHSTKIFFVRKYVCYAVLSQLQEHCTTATPRLTTGTLMMNRSYDQNFLKKILIYILLKFYFELHFEQRAQCYHNARYWDNFCSYYFGTERQII